MAHTNTQLLTEQRPSASNESSDHTTSSNEEPNQDRTNGRWTTQEHKKFLEGTPITSIEGLWSKVEEN